MANKRQATQEVSTQDFDDFMRHVQRHIDLDSARIIKGEGVPMAAAHLTLDGKEYVMSLVPTDLAPVEDDEEPE